MNRFARKLASLVGIVALIFAQLAVSAYACPLQVIGFDEAAAEIDGPGTNASGRDADSPALCQQHCQNGQQNINDTAQPLAFVSPAPVLAVNLLLEPAKSLTATAPTDDLLHATSPPHAILNCCFRI